MAVIDGAGISLQAKAVAVINQCADDEGGRWEVIVRKGLFLAIKYSHKNVRKCKVL